MLSATLVLGNLNGDDYVDVLDFGVYAGQFGDNLPVDTDCQTAAPHADLNGDGQVTPADETFISANFLEFGDGPCCDMGMLAATSGPVIEITVVELYLRGLGDLAVADLTHDGILNTADIAAFLAGARPEMPEVGFTGKDGGSWFDDGSWSSKGRPDAETNVTISKTVRIDRDGAMARNVRIQSGGTLDLSGGALTARNLTVDSQGTLRLNGAASLLQVQSLILSEGASLEWDGGIVEIDGGQFSQAEIDLLIGSGTLRLLEGATATVERDVFIGLTPTAVGGLEIDGDDSTLVAGGTLYIGVNGLGVASVTEGGQIVAPQMLIGQMGQLLGNGVLSTTVFNDGLLQPTGTLRIDGAFVQSELGGLEIQLDEAGSDLLEISGVAELGGTVTVTLPEGYVPQVGDRFDILTAEAVVGRFATVEVPQGVNLRVSYGLDHVTVEVAPTAKTPQLRPAKGLSKKR